MAKTVDADMYYHYLECPECVLDDRVHCSADSELESMPYPECGACGIEMDLVKIEKSTAFYIVGDENGN